MRTEKVEFVDAPLPHVLEGTGCIGPSHARCIIRQELRHKLQAMTQALGLGLGISVASSEELELWQNVWREKVLEL